MELICSVPKETVSNLSFFEIILKTLPSVTPIIALLALGVAYFGYRRQRRLHQEKLSYDFVHFYQNDKELIKHRDNLNDLFKKLKIENIDLKKLSNIDSENEYAKSIMFILNTWERCAHAIKEELIDEDYFYNIFHVVALRVYDVLEDYIDQRRKKEGNRTAYINFRWLAERWKMREHIESSEENFTELNKLIIKTSDHSWILRKKLKTGNKNFSKTKSKKLYKKLTLANRKKGFMSWIKSLLPQK
ncbi:DUF4760 domain-containing protein [Pectobacterium carotovorum]|uniref:DUF4760 domain-containing protein n=1 Tax=Pectobacterium carotovorum TaxID=554 RepID=UPI00301ABBCC